MDTYDMNDQPAGVEPQEQPKCEPQTRSNSPFANSPYTTPWQAPQPPAATQTTPVAQPYDEKPAPKVKKPGIWWKSLVTSVTVAAISCGITAAAVTAYWQSYNTNLTRSFDEKLAVLRQELTDKIPANGGNSSSGSPGPSVEGGLTPAQVYAQNVDSVVALECTVTQEMFGQTVSGVTSGSGFVLTADGYIVSNYHVVADAKAIKVTFNDGTEYAAQFVGGDESNDIALVKVKATDLRPVQIGSSDALIVGDQVAAVGNPLGELASTLTVGYISAKDRIVATDGTQINMLQTDAAINPGNSGGPLFNMLGQVIGITTAKYSGLTGSGATIEGIGFAIPMDDVYDMLEDLRQYGYITGAYLGVSVSDVDPDVAGAYGLPMGTLVRDVVDGSCAQLGGIQVSDIIVNLGGYEVKNLNDLSRALRKFKSGDEVTVTVHRGGNLVQLTLVLDEKPKS
jgi:S1-C subfamily serine protease